MNIRSPLQLLMGLLLTAVLLFSASAGQEKAMAGVCDSLRVTTSNVNGCCFHFSFSKNTAATVTRITVTPSGAKIIDGSKGSVNSGFAFDSTLARFVYNNGASGMPRGVDSNATLCFSSTSPVFMVLIRWYNGDQMLCQDSVVLQCKSTPPPPQGCFDILRDSVRCGEKGGYIYTFYIQNRSSFTGSTLSLRYNDPLSGITASPMSFNLGSLAPNATAGPYSINVTGSAATAGRRIVLIGTFCSTAQIHRDSLTGRIDSSKTCCDDSLSFLLPQCGSSGSNCFTVDSSRTNCLQSGFSWCFMVRNNSTRNVNEVDVTSGTNGQTTVIPLSPALAPGAWRSVCVTITGGTPGSMITNTLRLCNVVTAHDSVHRKDSSWVVIDTVIGRECCTDTFSIRVPQCSNTNGCLTFSEIRVTCDSLESALCFAITNNSSFPIQTLTLNPVSPAGISVVPSTITLNPPLAPGASRGGICVKLIGSSLSTASVATFIYQACDSTRKRCCSDSLVIQLPHCGGPTNECCSAFSKAFSRLASSGSSTGFGALNGWLSAGPSQIKTVSATILSSTINGQPVYAYMNFGLLYNAFGVGTVTPNAYGSEVLWQSGTGVSMSTLTQFYLSLKFPQMAANASRDTLRYCVKFSYTNVNCVTCDTTICFTTIRRRFSGNGALGRTMKDDNGGNFLGASNTAVSGSLTGANTGTMKIVFPTAPAELGKVNYVGVRIAATDKSVMIISATGKDASHTFTAAYGWAMSSFSANPGDEVNVDLGYSDLGGRKSLEHQVSLMYTLQSDPNSILEEDYVVTLAKQGEITKDSLTSTHAGLTDAYTFAVHLSNANGSSEAIAKMVITTTAPVKIIAVGPTASDTRALLQFGTLVDGNTPRDFVGEIVDGGQVAIAPSKDYGPIYLTLIGQQGETFAPTVHFATLNSSDQVISEGDLTLSDPAAGVTRGVDGETETGAMLRQSFPNPSSGQATIQFHLPHESQNVSLVVTDVKGSEVARLINGEAMATGEHAVYLNTGNLPVGTYYYTLRVGNTVETKSMQVMK